MSRTGYLAEKTSSSRTRGAVVVGDTKLGGADTGIFLGREGGKGDNGGLVSAAFMCSRIFSLSPFRCCNTPWFSKRAGTGLRRPIGKAEAFPGAREHPGDLGNCPPSLGCKVYPIGALVSMERGVRKGWATLR